MRERFDMFVPKSIGGLSRSLGLSLTALSLSLSIQGLHKFFDLILQAMQRHFAFDVLKCVILASPGFVKVWPGLGFFRGKEGRMREKFKFNTFSF